MVESLKREIKTIILRCDEDMMKASCMLYRNLTTFMDCVEYKKLNVWWKCVAKSANSFKSVSSVIALLCGTQPSGYGENFGSRQRCKVCCSYDYDSMEHIIFECTRLQDKRQSMMNDLTNTMPYGMRESFLNLNIKAKTVFILTGLGSATYVPEWQDIYLKASRLIRVMYIERSKSYKAQNNSGYPEGTQ